MTTENTEITEQSFGRVLWHPSKDSGMCLGHLLGDLPRFKAENIPLISNSIRYNCRVVTTGLDLDNTLRFNRLAKYLNEAIASGLV